jgi:hypothetical protein
MKPKIRETNTSVSGKELVPSLNYDLLSIDLPLVFVVLSLGEWKEVKKKDGLKIMFERVRNDMYV